MRISLRDATGEVGRGGAFCFGSVFLVLGCSGSSVDVSRVPSPGAGDDAGHWSDGGVFALVDSGAPAPPPKLCGSDGGVGARTDAGTASCSWARCPGAAALSLGPQNCVLMADATVRCATATGPELVDQGLSGVRSLAAGRIHRCALLSDESVWCWGDDKWGALGDPSVPADASMTRPSKVPGLANVLRLDTRDSFNQMDTTCVLTRSGEVVCWGGDWPRVPTAVTGLFGSREIAVADATVCGLRDAATIRCVYPDGTLTTYLLEQRIVGLAAAFYMLCARTEASDVFCMGAGGNPGPRLVPELRGATLLTAGLGQACGLLPDGTVACTPGSEGSTFMDRCEGAGVVDLRATQRSLCALHADGRIHCADSY